MNEVKSKKNVTKKLKIIEPLVNYDYQICVFIISFLFKNVLDIGLFSPETYSLVQLEPGCIQVV